ncbi:MAG: class I SAM-dependent methyltransferase [Acidobacteria bacterium]|jgi:SAM-dependent methyltransferase|nr:class I SAM-dependent methyltransferase [Acidobacteriota bacterium]
MSYAIRFPIQVAEGLEKTWRTDELLNSNSRAAYFDIQYSIIQRVEPLKNILEKFLNKDDLVLEAGCGSCRWVDYLKKQGCRPIGLDISTKILHIINQLKPGMHLSAGNVFSLPFRTGIFDSVLSSYVLEHFTPGPVLALKEAKRVLKPGGVLFFIVPFNNLFRVTFFNRLLDLACYYYPIGKSKFAFSEYRFNRKECRNFLRNAGFEQIQFFPDECLADWNKGVTTDYRNLKFYWPWLPDLPAPYQLPRWWRWLNALFLKVFPWSGCGGIICVARKPQEEK